MSSISQCIYDIQRYHELREKIEAIISKLNSASEYVGKVDFEIKTSYKVDGNSATISNQTTDLKNRIEDTSNYLSETVLPSIGYSLEDTRDTLRYLRRKAEEDD